MRAKRYRFWCKQNYKRRKAQGLRTHSMTRRYENSAGVIFGRHAMMSEDGVMEYIETLSASELPEYQKDILKKLIINRQ